MKIELYGVEVIKIVVKYLNNSQIHEVKQK